MKGFTCGDKTETAEELLFWVFRGFFGQVFVVMIRALTIAPMGLSEKSWLFVYFHDLGFMMRRLPVFI